MIYFYTYFYTILYVTLNLYSWVKTTNLIQGIFPAPDREGFAKRAFQCVGMCALAKHKQTLCPDDFYTCLRRCSNPRCHPP